MADKIIPRPEDFADLVKKLGGDAEAAQFMQEQILAKKEMENRAVSQRDASPSISEQFVDFFTDSPKELEDYADPNKRNWFQEGIRLGSVFASALAGGLVDPFIELAGGPENYVYKALTNLVGADVSPKDQSTEDAVRLSGSLAGLFVPGVAAVRAVGGGSKAIRGGSKLFAGGNFLGGIGKLFGKGKSPRGRGFISGMLTDGLLGLLGSMLGSGGGGGGGGGGGDPFSARRSGKGTSAASPRAAVGGGFGGGRGPYLPLTNTNPFSGLMNRPSFGKGKNFGDILSILSAKLDFVMSHLDNLTALNYRILNKVDVFTDSFAVMMDEMRENLGPSRDDRDVVSRATDRAPISNLGDLGSGSGGSGGLLDILGLGKLGKLLFKGGASAIGGIIRLLSTLAGPLMALVANPIGAIVLGLAVAGGIAYMFKDEIIDLFNKSGIVDFFTQTVPNFFTQLGEDTIMFFTEKIPNFFTQLGEDTVKFFTEKIPNFFGELGDKIIKFFTGDVKEAFIGPFETVKNFFTKVFTDFTNIFENVKNFFTVDVMNFFNDAKKVFTDIFETVKNFFTVDVMNFFTGVKNFFTVDVMNFFTETVKNFFTKDVMNFFTVDVMNFFTGVKNFFTVDVMNFFTEEIPKFFEQLGDKIIKFFTQLGEKIINFFTKEIPNFFTEPFKNIIDSVGNFVGGGIDKLVNIFRSNDARGGMAYNDMGVPAEKLLNSTSVNPAFDAAVEQARYGLPATAHLEKVGPEHIEPYGYYYPEILNRKYSELDLRTIEVGRMTSELKRRHALFKQLEKLEKTHKKLVSYAPAKAFSEPSVSEELKGEKFNPKPPIMIDEQTKALAALSSILTNLKNSSTSTTPQGPGMPPIINNNSTINNSNYVAPVHVTPHSLRPAPGTNDRSYNAARTTSFYTAVSR